MTGGTSVGHRRLRSLLIGGPLVLLLIIFAMLDWGGYLLIGSDALPSRADGAVILQASVVSENARIDGAVRLLQQGIVDKILLSIPKQTYWGLSFPEMAHAYLEKQYGSQVARQVEFCLTGPGVDSTEQEAYAIIPCLEKRGWRSVIVVTSNFHGRRAGMIWRKVCKREQPDLQIWVDGVADPSFRPEGWWRHRRYAKTWFFESTKLLWSFFAR